MAGRQPQSDYAEWLTLKEASERLKVHPTTLRRWADEGQIPVMLTPGGHRRFAASDIHHITERRHTIRRFGPVEEIWAREALDRARKAVMAEPQQAWLEGLDGKSRDSYRELGQRLMELTIKFIRAEDEDPALVAEATETGHVYGSQLHEAGLPLTEALRAAMFFGNALVETAVNLPQNVRIPVESQGRLIRRINSLLNAVQLGVAEMYDRKS